MLRFPPPASPGRIVSMTPSPGEGPRMTPAEIKDLRARLGLTQKQLAAKLGVAWRTVQQWESGRRKAPGPAVILLEQLAFWADRDERTRQSEDKS